MKIVLDTNVLVSGLISPHGPPAVILSLMLNEEIFLLYDNRILMEYRNVLARPKFQFTKENYEPFLEYITDLGQFIVSSPLEIDFLDSDDKKFYEVAVNGRAKYLITGNSRHFPEEKLIISPADFLENYRKQLGENGN